MDTPSPKVTVWIPSYNHAPYLAEAIESVLGQSLQDFELLIVDDGSSDGSLKIAQDFAARFPDKMRVATHPRGVNRGVSATANLAQSLARGRYWCGLASDDVLPVDSLKLRVEFLDRHPESDFVYGRISAFEHKKSVAVGRLRDWGEDLTSLAEPCESLILGNVVPAMAVMARRECWLGTGPHDETLDYSDWQMWFRMFARYRGGFIRKVLGHQRCHERNYSFDIYGKERKQFSRYTRDYYLNLDNILAEITPQLDTARNRAKIAMMIALHCYHLSDLTAAVHHFRRAIETDQGVLSDRDFMDIWISQGVNFWTNGDPGSPMNFKEWLTVALGDVTVRSTVEPNARILLRDASMRTLSSLLSNGFREAARQIISTELRSHPARLLRDRWLAKNIAKWILGQRCVQFLRRLNEFHKTSHK